VVQLPGAMPQVVMSQAFSLVNLRWHGVQVDARDNTGQASPQIVMSQTFSLKIYRMA